MRRAGAAASEEPNSCRGRPRLDDRRITDGILWVMKTGVRWRDLPEQYPSPATATAAFRHETHLATCARLLKALANDLIRRDGLDLSPSTWRAFRRDVFPQIAPTIATLWTRN